MLCEKLAMALTPVRTKGTSTGAFFIGISRVDGGALEVEYFAVFYDRFIRIFLKEKGARKGVY